MHSRTLSPLRHILTTAGTRTPKPPLLHRILHHPQPFATNTTTTTSTSFTPKPTSYTTMSNPPAPDTTILTPSLTTLPLPPRGLLLCLEGPDRTGKTTQSALLSHRLTSLTHTATHTLRFPDRTTPTGRLIDGYLKDSEITMNPRVSHLLFSANRWEVMMDSVLEKVIKAGENVVMDRYHGSGEAYTLSLPGVFDVAATELPGVEEWVRAADRGLPRPDVTVCLVLPEGEAGGRGGFGEERYEEGGMQGRVSARFKGIGEREGWVFVSGEGGIEEVGERVWKAVVGVLEKGVGELGKVGQ